jgi:hypothetical protein
MGGGVKVIMDGQVKLLHINVGKYELCYYKLYNI